jgi:phosphate-selective porin OprO and OprP
MKIITYWLPLAGLLGTALLTLNTQPVHAEGSTDSDSGTLEALRAKIEELDQQVRILERKQENSEESNKTEFKKIPVIKADDKGLSITSQDKSYQFRLRGLLQADFRTFLDQDGQTSIDGQDGFLLRRVRPRFQGKLGENLAGTVRILDASANYKFSDNFQLKGGQFKSPIGLERLQSAANVLFIERGFATNFVPTRDIGIQLHGAILENNVLDYAFGIFNGSNNLYDARANLNDNESLDLAARLFAHPFKDSTISELQGLGVGVAATWGQESQPIANNASGQARERVLTPGQNTAFRITEGNGASYDGDRIRVNPELYYYYGPWSFLGEAVYNSQDYRRGGKSETLDNWGWTAQASYVITGEDASYNGIKPLNPLGFKEGGFGAWEIAARVGGIFIDDDAFSGASATTRLADPNFSAEQAISYGLGLNWYWSSNIKWQLNYELTQFRDGPGANFDRNDEHFVAARFQIAF